MECTCYNVRGISMQRRTFRRLATASLKETGTFDEAVRQARQGVSRDSEWQTVDGFPRRTESDTT